MKSDIDIAQGAELKPIQEIAAKLGIDPDNIELYGKYKGKISYDVLKNLSDKAEGKLILVTAINPTPAGEGKTTTTVGLGDALNKLGKKTMITLREPSLGPVFGVKGGAAGGGYAQVVPMEDINLHFTGDLHAVGTANNLLAAMIDNHIHHGNKLDIDISRITWKRCMDMNDRQLRFIVDGLNGKANGVAREDGFDITVASEVMAVLCLSTDLADLKQRLKRIVVGYDKKGEPVTCGQLKAEGAMTAILKEASKPNLVQTLEHTPALIHGGPFANIAHGCNSVIATKAALKLADYVVTEAGFGADLGAEKFFDIKCRTARLKPSAVVIVATIRALKMHGGCNKKELSVENLDALKKGMSNLQKHIENITDKFGLQAIVAVNKFPKDTEAELNLLYDMCKNNDVDVAISDVWARGGEGGLDLAKKVLAIVDSNDCNSFKYLYDTNLSIKEKIKIIATQIYGARGVIFTSEASKEIKHLEAHGFSNLPICMAKTQYSLSDDPKALGRPLDFKITVRNIKVSAGAGFIVALTGDIMTMPGLSSTPSAEGIDVDDKGRITGLF